MHELLRAFEAQSGFPILLNTFFNVAGEPIVETLRDAIATFLRSAIDVLVLDSYYVDTKKV